MKEIEKVDPKEAFLKQFEGAFGDDFLPKEWDQKKRDTVAAEVTPSRVKTGMVTSIPMICRGEKCVFKDNCHLFQIDAAPVGFACHPAGTLIMTKDGEIPIEDLHLYEGKLWGWEKHHNIIRSGEGYGFKVSKNEYCGTMVTITANDYSHQITHNHISAVRFNENALDKFAVYIMCKNNFWRIGKTKLFSKVGSNKNGHKTNFGISSRVRQEDADAIWILGVYDSNSEALLMEEYFSIISQTSKVCFAPTINHINSKWDGLYKWVTEEELLSHHKKLQKDRSFYAEFLNINGLSIDHPIWTRKEDRDSLLTGQFGIQNSLFVRACNIIPEIMDVPCKSYEPEYQLTTKRKVKVAKWVKIDSIDKNKYHGYVYGLDVNVHKTYFANKIATHNCPYELGMVRVLMSEYVDKLEVDINDIVEYSQIRDLVNLEVQDMRAAKYLSKESFIQENVVGISGDGEPIFRKELHLAVELSEKTAKRKSQLLKQLAATREAKIKARSVDIQNAAALSNVMENYKEAMMKRDQSVLDRLGIKQIDTYIQIPPSKEE